MDTNALKKFAQEARRQLLAQVEARLEKVLHTDSVELREKMGVVNELRAQLKEKGKDHLVEEVAYTWFNRFCALRYMDVNHITRVGVVSPIPGFSQPEILQEAKQGIFDSDWRIDQSRVQGLLNGAIPSANPEGEAYRLLLVAVCNSYAEEMDFLFSRIEGYTELLMPEDLLSTQSVLHAVREALTEDACQDVEVIGWLYQFYISEKKDEVMGRKGAVPKADIPAVTQLFTPHWIVRYMVENTLGRLWLLNHPDSKIRDQMDYYISPEGQETDFLKVESPEALKILDPACGSGHILTYAFDLLAAIYEEMGYDPISIPRLILEKNLYGIEIDKRAAMLASFALMMKAVERDKRFFRRKVQPNILEMEDVSFDTQEIQAYMAKVGEDLWTQELWEGLQQFENAKTFGSLIHPVLKNVPKLREQLDAKGVFDELFLAETNRKVFKVLEMSEYLSPRYQVVVANPPYLNFSKYSMIYKNFASTKYPTGKTDTFTMFIEQNSSLIKDKGYIGMITMQSWMFLSTYEMFRDYLLQNLNVLLMAHLGPHAFDSIGGEVVSTTTFILTNKLSRSYDGTFFRLLDGKSEEEKIKLLLSNISITEEDKSNIVFKASRSDFLKVPGFRIIYWIKNYNIFQGSKIEDYFVSGGRNKTHNDKKYLRYVWEISLNNPRWRIYVKGGEYRKFYGNEELVVDWSEDARAYYDSKGGLCNPKFWNKEGITWSLTSTKPSFRLKRAICFYSSAAPTIFNDDFSLDNNALAYLNSNVVEYILQALNPTLSTTVGDVFSLPYKGKFFPKEVSKNVDLCIECTKKDWDAYETSNKFSTSFLLLDNNIPIIKTLKNQYLVTRYAWQEITNDLKELEEENNRIIINLYELQANLSPVVPLNEITLNCNPHYRYGTNYNKEQLEARLLEDTMKEFISYAVGCTFGRYSLDKPGLILANQGETVIDYQRIIGEKPTFAPTETNVIPIVEGGWFTDGAVARFKQFLRVTFGEENFPENLRFIEDALGKDLEKYFTRDFYQDHVKMYKKRPIYWLFSSAKGSFNALIYMHRYQPETVSVVLNQYLREYRDKLTAHRRNLERISSNASASAREKSQALKEIEDTSKILAELKEYEDEILYPLASKQIQIDLDDGVAVNYAKFGKALKKI